MREDNPAFAPLKPGYGRALLRPCASGTVARIGAQRKCGAGLTRGEIPDFAALNPGYEKKNAARFPARRFKVGSNAR